MRAAWLLALGVACSPSSPTIPPATASPTSRWSQRVVASGLANPRGIVVIDPRTLWVAEAGTGDASNRNTGRLLALTDADGDGRYEARAALLEAQPSVHIVERLEVHRDEVFGFADIERGNGMILASVADPTEGSVVWRIDGEPQRYGHTDGNANSMAFHPTLQRWFAVQSFANTAIDLATGEVVAQFAPLEAEQQAVPSAIIYEPDHDALLVALFSGQRGGDVAGSGVDFVRNSGRVVRVNPRTQAVSEVVGNLNAPTDLALDAEGALLVLEFCDAFVGPVADLTDARHGAAAGGFARFSGRLVRIDRQSGARQTLAEGLDLPTHLAVHGERVLVAVGQGTPGRAVVGPDGNQKIDGRIIELRPPIR
ncbi:MAG: hypothetical protein AAF721_31880 [Myxococcota bacterium]